MDDEFEDQVLYQVKKLTLYKKDLKPLNFIALYFKDMQHHLNLTKPSCKNKTIFHE